MAQHDTHSQHVEFSAPRGGRRRRAAAGLVAAAGVAVSLTACSARDGGHHGPVHVNPAAYDSKRSVNGAHPCGGDPELSLIEKTKKAAYLDIQFPNKGSEACYLKGYSLVQSQMRQPGEVSWSDELRASWVDEAAGHPGVVRVEPHKRAHEKVTIPLGHCSKEKGTLQNAVIMPPGEGYANHHVQRHPHNSWILKMPTGHIEVCGSHPEVAPVVSHL